jgi:hypothetical protein
MLLALSRSIRLKTKVPCFMLAVSVFCLSNVGLILLHKQLTSLGTEEQRKDLVALDYRKEGYTAADVESVLRCVGRGVLLLLLLLAAAAAAIAAAAVMKGSSHTL